jgi:hypothetical protein
MNDENAETDFCHTDQKDAETEERHGKDGVEWIYEEGAGLITCITKKSN